MEKRDCKRKIRRLNISFSDGTESLSGISSDLSCSGLFIRTRKSYKEGTVITMELELEEGLKIPLTGIVRRSLKTQVSIRTHMSQHKNGMGVELTEVPAIYEEYVKRLYTED